MRIPIQNTMRSTSFGNKVLVYTLATTLALTTAFSAVGCKTKEEVIEEVNNVTPVTETVVETPQKTIIETKVEEQEPMEEVIEPEIQESYFDTINDRLNFAVDDNMFPEAWYAERINPKVESLKPEEIERSKALAIASLKNYPEDVLRNDLEQIYFFNYLEFFGVEYGGTNSSYLKTIYVVNNGEENGRTDIDIKKTTHHEFSSILLDNYIDNFSEDTWNGININNFEYLGTGVEAIRQGKASKTFDPELNKLGFLYEYAQSSLENDFNSFAENMLSGDKEFWKIYDEYPLIQAKANLTAEFYGKIREGFSIDYFRNLAQE